MGYGESQVVLVLKNLPTNAGRLKRCEFSPWVRKIPWRRAWQLTPVFLPEASHGQRSLAGYSSWGRKRIGHNVRTECAHVLGVHPEWDCCIIWQLHV